MVKEGSMSMQIGKLGHFLESYFIVVAGFLLVGFFFLPFVTLFFEQ